MPRERRGVEADALGIDLHDIGDRLGGEPVPHGATLPDRAKYRTSHDAGRPKPSLQRGNRAGHAAAYYGDGLAGPFLVGLAMPDGDLEAEFALLEVLEVKGDELGAAE